MSSPKPHDPSGAKDNRLPDLSHKEWYCGIKEFVDAATKALLREWQPTLTKFSHADDLSQHLDEALRRQGLIGKEETAETFEIRQMIYLHVTATAVADPRLRSRDPALKTARRRLKRLQRAQAEISKVFAEDLFAPTHASILATLPPATAHALVKSYREFWTPISGAVSFRGRLLGKSKDRGRRPHPTWDGLIIQLARIYTHMGGERRTSEFLAGLCSMNAALPSHARLNSPDAVRKRVQRIFRNTQDRSA
jgi:hypothetical protein